MSKVTLEFSNKGRSIPIEQRPLWRIALICIIIDTMGNKQKSLDMKKLRIMNWILIRKSQWEYYYNGLINGFKTIPSIATDKYTDKAIELGLAKDYFQFEDSKISLKDNGFRILQVCKEESLFTDEFILLNEIKSKITIKFIDKVMGK